MLCVPPQYATVLVSPSVFFSSGAKTNMKICETILSELFRMLFNVPSILYHNFAHNQLENFCAYLGTLKYF